MTVERPIEQVSPVERTRLVRLCARLSGNPDVAEDLVQETLLEAWRHEQNLRDPERRIQWLFGIARNVYLRWLRKHGRELERIDRSPMNEQDHIAEGYELGVELERGELAQLLDRALKLLPSETRSLLISRYIDELSTAEVAARLGMPPGTVAVRLHRGKLALRRVLATEFRDEVVAYDLTPPDANGFQETHMWCFLCGRRRMTCRLDVETDEFLLRCDVCCQEPDTYVTHSQLPGILHGVRRHRAAYTRTAKFLYEYNWHAVTERSASCLGCGSRVGVDLVNPGHHLLSPRGEHGVFSYCTRCGGINESPLRYMVLGMPELQRFWRLHPRMRLLPEREIEVDGRPALLLGAESVSGHATIEVVCAPDTFGILSIHSSRRV